MLTLAGLALVAVSVALISWLDSYEGRDVARVLAYALGFAGFILAGVSCAGGGTPPTL